MYILTSKYFPLDYWPDLYFPALPDVAVDIQYTEVMDFAVCIATSAGFSVVLPNDVDAVTGTMVVSGAGSPEVNGNYYLNGKRNGYPEYTLESSIYDYAAILYDSGMWVLAVERYVPKMFLYYVSTSSAESPELVDGWEVASFGTAVAPAPTVTAQKPTLTEVAAFTVEMPMIIDFELYEELSA